MRLALRTLSCAQGRVKALISILSQRALTRDLILLLHHPHPILDQSCPRSLLLPHHTRPQKLQPHHPPTIQSRLHPLHRRFHLSHQAIQSRGPTPLIPDCPPPPNPPPPPPPLPPLPPPHPPPL